MQVDVVGHDDGANDAHGLQQLSLAAAGAGRQEQPSEQRSLSGAGHHVLWGGAWSGQPLPLQRHLTLHPDPGPSGSAEAERGVAFVGVRGVAALASHLIAKGQGHNGNKESKKGFQLPQP